MNQWWSSVCCYVYAEPTGYEETESGQSNGEVMLAVMSI